MLEALTREYRRATRRLEIIEQVRGSNSDLVGELCRQTSTIERMILACEPATPADAAAIAVMVSAYQLSVSDIDQEAAETGANAVARYLLASAGTDANALGLGSMSPMKPEPVPE